MKRQLLLRGRNRNSKIKPPLPRRRSLSAPLLSFVVLVVVVLSQCLLLHASSAATSDDDNRSSNDDGNRNNCISDNSDYSDCHAEVSSAASTAATSTAAAVASMRESRAQYYFRSEVARSTLLAMKMGGYDGDGSDSHMDSHMDSDFLEAVLQKELEMVRAANNQRRRQSELKEERERESTEEMKDSANSTEEWQNYSFEQMYNSRDCIAHMIDQQKPLYTADDWATMRSFFWHDFANVSGGYLTPPEGDLPPSPYYAAYTHDGKGRGVFASRNLQKGELVHSGWTNVAFFDTGHSWRTFVMTLPNWKMACDVMEWTWIQRIDGSAPGGGRLLLVLNMDDAAFLNDGRESKSNIRAEGKTELDFYATKDIEKGSEILYKYSNYETPWEEFGLGF